MEQSTLQGRVALVTGSSGAVGSSVVSHLRNRGAKVVGIHGGRSERPGELAADLTDESSVMQAFDAAEQRHGPLQIVVHTVGGFVAGGRLHETSLEDWDWMQRLNVLTSFLCLREAMRRLRGAKYGRIILLGAASGQDLPAGRAAYAVAKAAVHDLVTVASKEVGGTGVTVNAIAPYIIDTPQNRTWGSPDPATWVTPDEIGKVVEDLCDPASSVNGRILRLPVGP